MIDGSASTNLATSNEPLVGKQSVMRLKFNYIYQ